MECFDPVGFGTFLYVLSWSPPFTRCSLPSSPVVQMHVGKDEQGQPVTIIGTDDVARSIAFLASDEARMVNGALLPIDAAWSTI